VIIQLLMVLGTTAVGGLFAFKIASAAINAYKDTQIINRRFVDTLHHAVRNNLTTIKNLNYKIDNSGTHIITFELDRHLFKIIQPATLESIDCEVYHREYHQKVLHFAHHFSSNESSKHISTEIIRNEEKDIPIVEKFIQMITSMKWNNIQSTTNQEEKKDYTLVNGSISNSDIPPLNMSKEETHELLPVILHMKEAVSHLPSFSLRESYEVVLKNLQRLLSAKTPLDSENQHNIERLLKKELISMHKDFLALSPDNQKRYEPVVHKSLEIMNKYITLLILENEKKHIANLEIQLRLNEENYKK